MDLHPVLGVGDLGDVVDGVADRAARVWLAGGLVGLPTETVYGLSADAQDPVAVARIYEAKGRPADHPLIVHVQGAQALAGWSAGPNPAAERLAEAFWPGALTVIVARSERAGDFITGGQDTVALRCPDHPVAQACLEALARLSGDPARGVAAPSANRFGRVSPTRAGDVLAEVGPAMDPARDLVLDGGPCAIGVESTIVDCTATPPRVLRLGAISQEQVDAVLAGDGASLSGGEPTDSHVVTTPEATTPEATTPDVTRLEVTLSMVVEPANEAHAHAVRAPGTLESHYAPAAEVLLVESSHATPADLTAVVEQGVERPAERPAEPPARDPFTLTPLEGWQPARIMGEGPAWAFRVGLVGAVGVVTPPGWTRLAAPADAEQYARDLYAALRQADELHLDVVVAVLPDPSGGPLALAVRDRLARAAHPDRT